MGGDGMTGMAAAILLFMGLGLLIFALIAGGLGWLVARGLGWQGRRRGVLIAALVLLGCLGGWLAMNWTFYEGEIDPPPELTLRVPPGFAEPWAIVLQDPARGQPLVWRGGGTPFEPARAELALPKGGVVRVRDFGAMAGRGDLNVVWSNGAVSTGAGSGPAPDGVDAQYYIAMPHQPAGASGPSADLPYDEALAAYIKAREN